MTSNRFVHGTNPYISNMIETITFVYTVLLFIQNVEPLSRTTGVGAGHTTVPLFQQNRSCRRHQEQTVIIVWIITNDPTSQTSQCFFQFQQLQKNENMLTKKLSKVEINEDVTKRKKK